MAGRAQIEALVNDLYRSWYSSLLGYAYRSCRSLALSEDLVQETLFALCHDLANGADIQNPKGWTLTVLRHRISKHFERERERGLEQLERDQDAVDRGPDADPALSLMASDQLSHLLSFLTRREEEVILLRLEGLKYQEIARQLGLHVSSVKTLIARALQRLENLGDEERRGEISQYVEPDTKASRR